LTKLNLMAFPGTSLLHKFLPRYPPNSSFGDQVQKIPQMVNVPIGGPEVQFLSGEDVKKSPEGGSLQSYLMKIRDNGSFLGSDFLANSPPPREVISNRELMHNQHCGAHLDRYRENGNTPKHKLEESIYSTKVVVGTTRSKRLVKTTQWVADAMNKLTGRSSPAADGAALKLPVDRQMTTQAALSMSNSKASNSPSAVSCMDDANAAEPKKLILRINLSKLKEKKEKKKQKKVKYQRLSSCNRELMEAESSYVEMNVEPLQSFDSTMYDDMPPLSKTQIQLEPAGGPERSTFLPQMDFRDLEHSPTIYGSLTRLVAPEAEFVDIVPALDVGCHLLPILRHRTRLFHSLPPR